MIILAHCICAKIIIDSVLKAQHKACQIYFGRLHFWKKTTPSLIVAVSKPITMQSAA